MSDWPEIVRQHTPMIWRTVYRLTAREADAADCFQETFVAALDVAKPQDVRNWAALLQRIATARAIDCLRRRRREQDRYMAEDATQAAASNEAGPLDAAQTTELAHHLRMALAKLPPSQSEVFCLRHLNGLSYDEIAAEMGISVDHVGVTLHRARRRLRDVLATFHACGKGPR